MKDGKGLAELRIGEFTSEYFERVYYYCLKKTGSETEAAELSQDIALGIIEQLRRGACPDSFSGWVWQIVRNIYAGWATEKHKARKGFRIRISRNLKFRTIPTLFPTLYRKKT